MTATKRSPRSRSTAPATQGSGWAPPRPTVDDRIPRPHLQSTRAITIGAAPQQVWPWLVQVDHPARLHDNEGSGQDDNNP
jgi:hypothetical protein